jgi:hypothetical protein
MTYNATTYGTTYDDLNTRLQGRCKNSRKLMNNTYAEHLANGDIGIRLHSTYVLVFHPDMSITLNSNGWRTYTTKDRINGQSMFTVYQRAFNWYVWIVQTGETVDYADGMTVHADGSVTY